MLIYLYNSSAELSRVDKQPYLHEVLRLTGTFRDSADISNPSVLLELSQEALLQQIGRKEIVVNDFNIDVIDDNGNDVVRFIQSKVVTTNYAYIEEFNRYYFISNISVVRNNLWLLELSCDVLMSYAYDIKNLEGMIERQEFDFNPMLEDNRAQFENGYTIERTVVPNNIFCGKLADNPLWCYTISVIGGEYKASTANLPSPTYEYDVKSNVNNDLIYPSHYTSTLSTSNTVYIVKSKNDLINTINVLSYSSVNLDEYCLSVRYYPFNIEPQFYSEFCNYLGLGCIYIGGERYSQYSIGGAQRNFINPDSIRKIGYEVNSCVLDLGSFTISISSYVDYKSIYQLFIPYYGWVVIDVVKYANKRISVKYIVNISNGNCKICLSTNDGLIDCFDSTLGFDVPTSILNYRGVSIARGLKVIAATTSIASSILNATTPTQSSTVKTIAPIYKLNRKTGRMNMWKKGGDFTKTSTTEPSPADAVSGISGGVQQLMEIPLIQPTPAQIGSPDEYVISRLPNNLIIMKMTPKLAEPLGYAKLYGRPSHKYKKFSDLHGYTEVGAVHVENIPTATASELEEIEQLLMSGVIF